MSKGQGLSMNVIIIAAISLVVLVVLVVLTMNGFFTVKKGTGCEVFDGECFVEGTECGAAAASEYPILQGHTCAEATPVCCVKSPGV